MDLISHHRLINHKLSDCLPLTRSAGVCPFASYRKTTSLSLGANFVSQLFSCESVHELFIQTPVWLPLQRFCPPPPPPTTPPAAVLLESKISAVWKAWSPAKAGIVAEWKICSFFFLIPHQHLQTLKKALTFSLTLINGDVKETSP